MARSHRVNIPNPPKPSSRQLPLLEDPLEDVSAFDEDLETDFEETPRFPDDVSLHAQQGTDATGPSGKGSPSNAMRDRAGSMATVRLHRRARLAEKLKEVYDLDDIREVWAGMSVLQFTQITCHIIRTEMPCWLLRSVREYQITLNIL